MSGMSGCRGTETKECDRDKHSGKGNVFHNSLLRVVSRKSCRKETNIVSELRLGLRVNAVLVQARTLWAQRFAVFLTIRIIPPNKSPYPLTSTTLTRFVLLKFFPVRTFLAFPVETNLSRRETTPQLQLPHFDAAPQLNVSFDQHLDFY